MTSKYNLSLFWMFYFVICNSFISVAQTASNDSLAGKQDQTIYIGYGEQPAWKTTSAVSTVKGYELEKSFTPNVANTLFGKLPGLSLFQGSGEPGLDDPGIAIRGYGTFNTNSILLMVDGFESTFAQLTVAEIESISLLKDAAATAIYGSRGANGVMLVTTKKGQKGPLKISFSTQQGFQSASQLPRFLGSYDYASLYNEALANDGKPDRYTQADLDAYQSKEDPYFHPDVNWYEQVLREVAPISNYNLKFSGGDETVRYFVSLNGLIDNGLYIKAGDMNDNSTNSKYSRYNFRSNVDIKLTKRLSAELILGGTIEDKANPGGVNTTGTFNLMASLPPNSFPVYNPHGTFGGNSTFANPLGNLLETGKYTSNGRTLQSTFRLTEQLDFITKGLSVSGSVSFNNYFKSYSNKTKTYPRFSITSNGVDTIYTKFGQSSAFTADEGSSDQWRNYTIQSFLNYSRSVGVHDINAMMMFNSDNYTLSGNNLPYKHLGIGGRFTYSRNQKYIGEFSFGYNGSENFPKNKRYGFFPAGSLGWIASNENFLKGNKLVNFLKLRASFGLVGNDDIGGSRFMFDQYYQSSSGYYFGATNTSFSGMVKGSPANTNVTWEKDKKANISMEATFFNHIDVTLDLFNNDRYDILATPYRSIPQYMGITLPMMNVGKVNNKGFEAIVRYNVNQNKAFNCFLEASVWSAINKIVYNDEAIALYDYQYRTGQPYAQPFGLEAIGFFQDQTDINDSPKQIFTTVIPGDIKYKDLNNDNVIDQNDIGPIGKTNLPDFTFGLHSGLKYKGFDLDVMFQGVSGRSVYLGGYYFHAFQNNGQVGPIALGRWTPETALTATYPRLSADNNQNNYRTSSFWQRDGSFVKLRSLELGYSFPLKILDKFHADDVRVFVNGTNLFSLDHIEYSDPETMSGYPAVKTFSIGTKIQF